VKARSKKRFGQQERCEERAMRTTETAARIASGHQWVQTALVAAGVALLVVAMPGVARAEVKRDPVTAATDEKANCEDMGGEATITVHRTAYGVESTQVSCEGGFADGITCDNDNYGTVCWADSGVDSGAGSSRRPVSTVIELLESGSVAQIDEVLADLEAGNDQGLAARASVATADDQDHQQDTHANKGKHGKHGKKGDKHRKR
jgi:hypothetical protein